jgi:hypothetical protein
VTRLLQTIQGKTYYPLLVIAALTVPIQGLPNFLVYLAPSTWQNPITPFRALVNRVLRSGNPTSDTAAARRRLPISTEASAASHAEPDR